MTAIDSFGSAEPDAAEAIGRVVKVAAAAQRAWIEARVPEGPLTAGASCAAGSELPDWLALAHRPAKLYLELSGEGRVLLEDLRCASDRWAHHAPFDDLEVVRLLDRCRRWLLAVGAHDAAGTVERQMRTAVSMAQSNVAASELLRRAESWRRLDRQHPGVEGRFICLQTFHASDRGITQ